MRAGIGHSPGGRGRARHCERSPPLAAMAALPADSEVDAGDLQQQPDRGWAEVLGALAAPARWVARRAAAAEPEAEPARAVDAARGAERQHHAPEEHAAEHLVRAVVDALVPPVDRDDAHPADGVRQRGAGTNSEADATERRQREQQTLQLPRPLVEPDAVEQAAVLRVAGRLDERALVRVELQRVGAAHDIGQDHQPDAHAQQHQGAHVQRALATQGLQHRCHPLPHPTPPERLLRRGWSCASSLLAQRVISLLALPAAAPTLEGAWRN